MDTVLDQSRDVSGRERHRLLQLHTAPDFVKKADHNTVCGDATALQPRDYAEQHQRIYPMHTAAATWLSSAYFFDKQANFDKGAAQQIRQRLLERAQFFKIGGSFLQLEKAAAAHAATGYDKLTDGEFAYVSGDGEQKQRHMPLRNAGEVKAAAAWFEQYKDRFALATRQQVAGRILTKVAAFGAVVANAEWLNKQAGFGACTAKDAAALVRSRIPYLPQNATEVAGGLEKLAATMTQYTAETRDPQKLAKLACIVDQLDRQNGLQRLYGNGLDRPEDVLFSITRDKVASFVQSHIHMTNGAVFEKEALERLRVNDVREHMGDFADAVSVDGIHVDAEKVAEIARTLPRGDASTFQRMCQSLGVLPVTTKSASSPAGMTVVERDLWASAYQSGGQTAARNSSNASSMS